MQRALPLATSSPLSSEVTNLHEFPQTSSPSPQRATQMVHGKHGASELLLLLLSHFSHVQLCNPIDGSPPGPSVPGILQTRTLEGWPFPSPGDLRNPGIQPGSPALQGDSLLPEPSGGFANYKVFYKRC